ncbi:MAG: ABC transporter permease [Acidobacteriota bacterium]
MTRRAARRPDFAAIVRRRLPSLDVAGAREAEIVEELVQLLDDCWDDHPPADLFADDEAGVTRWVDSQVPCWSDLATLVGSRRPRLLQRSSPLTGKGNPLVSGWTQDLRAAGRLLRRSPMFTLVAIATLAVGIGLNSAVFSLVESVLLRPPAVGDADRLTRIYSSTPDGFMPQEPMSFLDLEDIAERTTAFSNVTGYALTKMALQVDGETQIVVGEMAIGTYFETLGLRPHIGRFFTADDDRRGEPSPVAVLAYSTWQRRFGADPQIAGRDVLLNGRRVTIIGVLPSDYHGLFPALSSEIWVPLQLGIDLGAVAMQGTGDRVEGLHLADNRGRRWLWAIGRLAPDSTFAAAEDRVTALGGALAREYPESNEGRDLTLFPFRDVAFLPGAIDQGMRFASLVLMGFVALVLLIASANLASMLLARAAHRRREIATRRSLGASRARLIRQLLVEGLALALLGGAAGLLIGWAAASAMSGLRISTALPIEVATQLNWRVVAFTFGLSSLAALAFGLAPAIETTRASLASTLREDSGTTSGSKRRRRLQSLLVVGQVALSTVLLVCAALSVRSVGNARIVDAGVDPAGVVTARLDPELQGRADELTAPLFDRLRLDLLARPEVSSVAYASHLPLTLYISTQNAVPVGGEDAPEREWPQVDVARVDGEYFRALGIPLRAGRAFEPIELEERRRVVVINEHLAERFWPGETAVGRQLRFTPDGDPWQVVGVARDGKYRTLGEAQRSFAYRPLSLNTSSRFVIARLEGIESTAGLGMVRRTIRAVDDELAISSLASFEQAMAPSLALPRLGAAFFGLFGLLGLFLASIGLYGVLAYSVSQRTHEIGIRRALGAEDGEVQRLVLRHGLVLTLGGLALGVAGSLVVTRALSAILYGIEPHDVATFATVGVTLLGVAIFACWLPARRALRIDPLAALRFG